MNEFTNQNIIIQVDKNDAIDNIVSLECQFFPETISDSYTPTYKSSNYYGGSSPILQYQGGGNRTITMSLLLFQESLVVNTINIESIRKNGTYNFDVNMGLSWLRALTYPKYNSDRYITPPPIVKLIFPDNFKINRFLNTTDSDNVIRAVVSAASIDYQNFFSNGTIRKAKVNLTFIHTPQTDDGIKFVGRM